MAADFSSWDAGQLHAATQEAAGIANIEDREAMSTTVEAIPVILDGYVVTSSVMPLSFVNPAALDPEHELRRFSWKVEAGAEYAITQPVFDAASGGIENVQQPQATRTATGAAP